MIAASSTGAMLDALRAARHVTFSTWFLHDGPVERALVAAAKRGAGVHVRLDGYLYGGTRAMMQANRTAVRTLRAAGADAALVHRTDCDGPDLHLKAAVCDGVAYLDDRNWNGAGDTVLRDGNPRHVRAIRQAAAWHDCDRAGSLSLTKTDALEDERRVLAYAPHCREADVESELLHPSAVTSALRKLAARGVHCRVLISARTFASDAATRATVRSLQQVGIDVRSAPSSEKLAILGRTRAWIGSAQATATRYDGDEIDWSLHGSDARFVRLVRARFNAHWRDSTPLTA